MNTYLNNARYVGWTAAALIFLTTLMSWITISGPFIGSMSAQGVETDDGKLMMGLAGVLAIVAFTKNHLYIGIAAGVLVVFYIYEAIHIMNYDLVDSSASKTDQDFASAYSVHPGIGLYLGGLVALALLAWSTYRYINAKNEGQKATVAA